MNNWEGSPPMEHAGFYLLSITLICEPGVVEYKFRINGNLTTIEYFGPGINRMTYATPEPQSIYHYFNDVNWNTWPATFEVDMNAEISAGNFDPSSDYLDVAGTFNNWEAHCVLSDREWTEPGIYTANILVDKLIPYIEFKFRINGDWATSEFPLGGPNRNWTVQDTAGGFVNLFQCIYNITDVPYPPYVYDLFISGELVVGEEITGNYTYFDPNADPEGLSLYQWYITDDSTGANPTIINGAVYQSYTIAEEDFGKYLVFTVTPVTALGEMGYTNGVISGQVGYTIISGIKTKAILLYPNPVSDKLVISLPTYNGNTKLSIFNVSGEKVLERQITDYKTQLDISALPRGVYFMRLQDEKMVEVGKMVKK